MKKLSFLLGIWDAADRYEKTVLNPNGGEGSGTYTTTLGPGGFFLLTDYRYQSPHGQSSGHQLLTWDPTLGRYRGCVVSNSLGCLALAGDWEGPWLVLSGQFEAHGMKIAFRQIFSDITDQTMVLRQYNGFDGAAPQLFGTTLFTKR